MVLTFHMYGKEGWFGPLARLRYPLLQRFRLISLPGGPSYERPDFTRTQHYLGKELQAAWLGAGADCHPTDELHPFEVAACPLSKSRDCWQCLYLLHAERSLKAGHTLMAATTSFESSELATEQFRRGPPPGWGQGGYFPFRQTGYMRRRAQPHRGEPFGGGCRWERRFLDSLPQEVAVVAGPPERLELPPPSGLLGAAAWAIYLLEGRGIVGLLSAMAAAFAVAGVAASDLTVAPRGCSLAALRWAFVLAFVALGVFVWGRGVLSSGGWRAAAAVGILFLAVFMDASLPGAVAYMRDRGCLGMAPPQPRRDEAYLRRGSRPARLPALPPAGCLGRGGL